MYSRRHRGELYDASEGMMYQPVQQWKRRVWRAGRLLQGKPLECATPLDGLDAAACDRFYAGGYQHIAMVAERIEAQTGCALESRRVLDFGCGVGRSALPLAERCEHVYGLDVSPAVLREADLNARRLNLSNVEWMEAGRLDELSGRYDLVTSFHVFQHIPPREGERIFATLLRGLRPGGAGAIQVILRPPSFGGSVRSYLYMWRNSYSLNRLGRLLTDAGVKEWHVKSHPHPMSGTARWSDDDVSIVFRKD
jgi:2-polyprenyl-3-methyl-5-hydroxy-6-metoxy-1,4-benzoquinol methylase